MSEGLASMTAELFQQAFTHHSAGRVAEAIPLYQAVLQRDPQHAEALHLLGVCEYQSGRFARAVELITAAINVTAANPAALNPTMHTNLGAAYVALGQNQTALACYHQAARMSPYNPDVYYNRGNVYRALGNTAAGIADFREALRLNPNYVQAYNNLGTALLEGGQLEEAAQCYQRAIELNPNYYRAYCNLGWIHQKLGRFAEANSSYQRALQLNPNYALAYNNVASLCFEQNQADAALVAYQRAAQLDPKMYDAHAGQGAVLAQQGKIAEARTAYERATAIKPNDGLRVRLALLTYVIPADEQEMIDTRQRMEAECAVLLQQPLKVEDPVKEIGTTPFYLAYQGVNEIELQKKIARLLLHAAPMLEFTSPHCRGGLAYRGPNRKPRVGFISKYFFDHPIGKNYAGIIRELSHDKFHLLVLRPTVPDDAVARDIAQAGHQTVTLDFDLVRARQQIAGLELDVLVYADLGMDPWTNYLAYARLAPVQCVLGGHPVTTGVPTMDYFISSRLMEPEYAQDHYSERLVQLDNLPYYYERPRLPEQLLTRGQLGLAEDAHCYVTSQTLFKYHPADDELFGRILRADPVGRLYFFCGRHPHLTQIMQQRLERSLPDVSDRIHFLPRMAGPQYLQVLAQADAMLDTLRFSGGTTSFDSLGVGAPLVTLPGEIQRGRITYGYYRKMGLMDLVARDRDDYVRLALRLGCEPVFRHAMRQKVRDASGVLFDNTDGVRELEDWFRRWTKRV